MPTQPATCTRTHTAAFVLEMAFGDGQRYGRELRASGVAGPARTATAEQRLTNYPNIADIGRAFIAGVRMELEATR